MYEKGDNNSICIAILSVPYNRITAAESAESGSECAPPSYNQLNYNDNLTRFFNSHPKTLTGKEANKSSSMLDSPKAIAIQALLGI
jgi:hypothetical protein